jgi:hypothetical protein
MGSGNRGPWSPRHDLDTVFVTAPFPPYQTPTPQAQRSPAVTGLPSGGPGWSCTTSDHSVIGDSVLLYRSLPDNIRQVITRVSPACSHRWK